MIQSTLWIRYLPLITLMFITLMFMSSSAYAHKPSDSYLTLDVASPTAPWRGRWDIALRDLDYALGLDSDGDGALTWGEVRRRHADIAAYALARLDVALDDHPCVLTAHGQQVVQHSDGAYTVLDFDMDCSKGMTVEKTDHPLNLTYRLFFDLDPSHRGLLQLRSAEAEAVDSVVLSPQQPTVTRALQDPPNRWHILATYWQEGIWHIWEGIDHILFLMALLLPSVLIRPSGRWQPTESFAVAIHEVLWIVTAFTVAHSITLSLAVLHIVTPPARWIETAIAATVIVVALDNLYPLPGLPTRRWLIAFSLGLIHGFGFANVLQDLGLPQHALVMALAGFNLGVETGQLIIVIGVLPLAFGLRRQWLYQPLVVRVGSIGVACVAVVWFIERAFDVQFRIPFV